MSITISPADAWSSLPASDWNESAARHLLRRIGWTATPSEVAAALQNGLTITLEQAFPSTPAVFSESKAVSELRVPVEELRKQYLKGSAKEQRISRKERREHYRQVTQDLSLQWLQFAADPARSASEKWVLFLSDVYVVSAQKVRNPAYIFDHFQILRTQGLTTAPTLTKAVSRSPAMIQYLDLQQSKKDAPNENFARELLELFVLGEGNYTEHDIKEAARAFTGYRHDGRAFKLARRQMDTGTKSVLGKAGRFTGDDVIDLAYQQPGAARFLPHELARFYLTEDSLPDAHLTALGDWWTQNHFDLRKLALKFFSSRLFFSSAYRENYFKSPVQLYLGLLQDLQLDVLPLPRQTLVPLRLMGQTLFDPPNVRGWVGGRSWINSSTLQARRQLVQTLFAPQNEDRLNADDRARLNTARKSGHANFTATPDALAESFEAADPLTVARWLVDNFLPASGSPEFYHYVADALNSPGSSRSQLPHRLRVLETLLQSPEYQLC